MNGSSDAHLCDLQLAAGRVEPCPEAGCPFWDDGECVVAGLRPDFEHDPELTQVLLSLRNRLARPEHRDCASTMSMVRGWSMVRAHYWLTDQSVKGVERPLTVDWSGPGR